MAWLGKVTLGNFSDIAEAVTKLSESVKNIEKNFDSALGFEDKATIHEGQRLSTERRALLEPSIAFGVQDISMPNIATKASSLSSGKFTEQAGAGQPDPGNSSSSIQMVSTEDAASDLSMASGEMHQEPRQPSEIREPPSASPLQDEPLQLQTEKEVIRTEDSQNFQETVSTVKDQEGGESVEERDKCVPKDSPVSGVENAILADGINDVQSKVYFHSEVGESIKQVQEAFESKDEVQGPHYLDSVSEAQSLIILGEHGEFPASNGIALLPGNFAVPQPFRQNHLSPEEASDNTEKLRAEVKMLEVALQGAAKQAQLKADEISRLLIENEKFKAALEDLKKKSSATELDALKEEYKGRLGAAERKVYALTKERDMLRREQSRKNDSSTLLKEKDEIIKQVMAEGEELSKKQAAQEAQMRKLRAQVRELEEEKQRLNSKLQVEEAKVESIKKDKAATERALQEAVERSQAELATQREFYNSALNEAKEAEAKAEARADSEAKSELERHLREAGEREVALIHVVEELRQALSRTEQQAALHEDMLRRDNEDLVKRCQAAELQYGELVARVPESTRPLLRQIEAIQESTAMRAEAWTGVERALNARLQEAEAQAAAAQERERAINERLTQNLSRMAVLEAQVSCLKAELAQLTRSLEKERQRASENRQEYLAALEAAATHEGHAKQFEEELRELRSRHKRELAEEKTLRQLLEKEAEHERKARIENEKRLGPENWIGTDNISTSQANSQPDYSSNRALKRFSSVSSAGSVEESYFLQASLDLRDDMVSGDRVSTSDPVPATYIGKSMVPAATLEQLEALLRQREGELSSYVSRLAALESTRDSLADELVNTTTQSEKLRAEVASVPGLHAELDALRRRHTSALELMGERDEEVEELRADIADLKQMYREQIDMLVSQIEKLSASIGTREKNGQLF